MEADRGVAMNLEKANLDELLIRNAIPQFIADLEAALQKNIENNKKSSKPSVRLPEKSTITQ